MMLNEPRVKEWHSQGLQLNYFEWGQADSPVLLLIHGNGDHARSWDRTAHALSANWRVIVPDLRGHGDSDWSPDGAYYTGYFVMDIADLIENFDVEHITLVGHSFGGVIALRYAAMYPSRVKQIVVIDGHGPSEAVKTSWQAEGATQRSREWIVKRRKLFGRVPIVLANIDEAVSRYQKTNPRLSDAQARALVEHAVRPVEGGYCWKRDPLVAAFTAEDFAQESGDIWRQITAPTLFMYAKGSWKFDPAVRELEQHFSQASGYIFEDAGHWLHHDQFEEFNHCLQDFLSTAP